MRKLAILVVEDDDAVGRMLGHALRGFDFSVQMANSGSQAIEIYKREVIDVVLMDVQMPDMDGPETMAALKKIDPTVVCCFMSAHPGRYEGDDFVRMGAAGIIQKPFALEELRQFLWRSAQTRTASKPSTDQSSPQSDRRAYPRKAATPDIKIGCFVPCLNYGHNLAMGLHDMSQVGLQLLLSGPIAVGEEIFVTLEGPAPMRPVMCAGKVVWTHKARDSGYSTGVVLDRGLAHADMPTLS